MIQVTDGAVQSSTIIDLGPAGLATGKKSLVLGRSLESNYAPGYWA
jgi:hypothetical protein